VHLVLARDQEPVLPRRQLGGILGHEGDAGAPEAGLGADRRRQPVPQLEAIAAERDLGRVAALLAAPAPVAARLLAGDVALLDQRHRHPALASQ